MITISHDHATHRTIAVVTATTRADLDLQVLDVRHRYREDILTPIVGPALSGGTWLVVLADSVELF